MGEVSTIGLDIAKLIFQIHGVDAAGVVVIRKRISRAKLLEFFAALPACLVDYYRPSSRGSKGYRNQIKRASCTYWGTGAQPTMVAGTRLQQQGSVYAHGYAVLAFGADACSAEYY